MYISRTCTPLTHLSRMNFPFFMDRTSLIQILEGLGGIFRLFNILLANSGYPDQTPHSAAADLDPHCLPTDLDLYCLPKSLKKDTNYVG